ncbi:ABC-2 type transport system permease protein [Halobacillus dabanensis]|uniref:ABC-2 type transport system permease protein n=1 Tax=Halobacillus dabanensis TaxID=240302 RepID=A0A1I3ZQV7_HALDA|nr:ABC transporter permease subunit [Halobacillus dabanensis]SFK46357.1 ABC-2 type transport system permease protein [Halobacillus dabanensis]
MSNFFKLIKNEQMKLYNQKATWIMAIILVILIIGAGVIFKVDETFTGGEAPTGDNWKEELQQQNEQLMSPDGPPDVEYPGYMNVEENQYRIENDIKPTEYNVWDFVRENRGLVALVSLFTIIVAAGITANEFRWGTIKLLLIRPISRTKILFAKYISVLIYALTMLFALFVLSFIVGSLLFGMDGFAATYVYSQAEEIKSVNIFSFTVFQYLLSFVELMMMATFAFMIAAVFRNTSLAIGLAIFLMMAGSSIVVFFMDKGWAKYILFANTDLNQFIEGTPFFSGINLGFSIAVLAVYYVLFMLLSWVFFTKRDVAGA